MCAAFLISASYDKQIRFWDGASGRTVRCFSFQDSQVNALWHIPDTTYLAVAGFGVLRVYDIGAAATNAAGITTPTTATGGGAGSQAPPLFSSYENSSAMNFTSLGSFPLHTRKSSVSTSGQLGETSTSSLFSATVDFCATLRPSADCTAEELFSVLYASSEDGHIRFFGVNPTTKLKLIRDISTGAAITCSALSPNRQTLLTGSQIGRVSVWHLPSIIAVATQQVPGATSTPFSSVPLQEITFDSDYTAIRSIAIEPLARWAVAATNAGKLHFLRFEGESNDSFSKSKDQNANTKVLFPDGTTIEHQEIDEGAAGESCEATSGSAVKPSLHGNSYLRPESVYRSALVSNELGTGVLTGNALGSPFAGNNRGSPRGALADSLDPGSQRVPLSSSKNEGLLPNDSTMNLSTEMSSLKQQFFMKVFHSFQAHYKYILKVAISPSTDLLVTCCADYTVGRFLIPPELQGEQFKVFHREDNVPSSFRGSEDNTCSTVQSGTYPAVALGSTLPISERNSRKTSTPCALLHSVEGEPTQPTVLEKPEDAAGIQQVDAISDNAELQKTNTTVEDGVSVQPSTRPVEVTASAQPGDAPDASSMLFSVIPSVSMEGNTQSHSIGNVQFKPLQPMVGHTRWVWDCVFSDCGRFLFTASSDQCLRMWTSLLADRVQSTCYNGHTKPVVCCILYYEKKRN